MVSDDPRNKYHNELDRLEQAANENNVTANEADAIREFLKAKDPEDITVTDSESDSKEPSTLAAYAQALRLVASRIDRPLVNADADDVNALMQSLKEGTYPGVKEDGLSENTLIQHQSAVRKFYRYHDDLGVDDEDIVIYRRPTTSVDDRDMFTREEVEAMREVIGNPRDHCLFELLVNTGQRIRALQTLRIKDVDTDEGVFYLNTDADGLKGADKNGKKRPLLGAKRAVYDWLQYHPTGNPDDFLITVRPSAVRGEPGAKLHQTTINRILKDIAEEADVKKPKHAHQFRHFFVTVAKRDYGLDNDTIKHLIGHAADSNIMETTYAHLNDDDYIKKAEVGAGLRDPEEATTLTPNICPTCDTQLDPSAKACPGCGMVFAPDAKSVEDQIDADMKQSYAETDPDDGDKQDKISQLDDLLEDPEVKQALLEKIGDG